MFVLETHEGTSYERVVDRGRKFRHASKLLCWTFRQPFQGSEEDVEWTVAPLREVDQERFSDTTDEPVNRHNRGNKPKIDRSLE